MWCNSSWHTVHRFSAISHFDFIWTQNGIWWRGELAGPLPMCLCEFRSCLIYACLVGTKVAIKFWSRSIVNQLASITILPSAVIQSSERKLRCFVSARWTDPDERIIEMKQLPRLDWKCAYGRHRRSHCVAFVRATHSRSTLIRHVVVSDHIDDAKK